MVGEASGDQAGEDRQRGVGQQDRPGRLGYHEQRRSLSIGSGLNAGERKAAPIRAARHGTARVAG